MLLDYIKLGISCHQPVFCLSCHWYWLNSAHMMAAPIYTKPKYVKQKICNGLSTSNNIFTWIPWKCTAIFMWWHGLNCRGLPLLHIMVSLSYSFMYGILIWKFSMYNVNNGPNGHFLFYVDGDLMMRRGMLPIIMLPDGDLRIVLHLVPFWIFSIWGSVHIEETVVGWRNHLRMKTSVT